MKLFQRKTTSELRDEVIRLRIEKRKLNERRKLEEEKAKLQNEIRKSEMPGFLKAADEWLEKTYGKRR